MGGFLQQVRVIGMAAQAVSADTRNGGVERRAYSPHALIAEAAQSLRECSDGDVRCEFVRAQYPVVGAGPRSWRVVASALSVS